MCKLFKMFKLLSFLLLSTVLVLPVVAQSGDELLLDTLRKKGIITYEEAEKIRIETTSEEKADSLTSLKGADINLGGELELEFRYTQDDTGIGDPNARFQFDKFVLKPEVTFKKSSISLKGELEFTPDTALFAEGGIYFKNLPLNSQIFTGLKTRFIGISRKTEVYPLLGTALWRYQQLQINLETNIKFFYMGVSIGEGLLLGTKQVSEDSSYKMLRDNRNAAEKTGHPEYGAKLGCKFDIGDIGKIDILGFGFLGRLNTDDIDLLKSKLSGYTSNSDTMLRYGGRMVCKLKDFTLVGEGAQALDGKLVRTGWYAQASYKQKFKIPYFCSFEPLVRYGQLYTDCTKSFAHSCSWDRTMFTFALVTEIVKNVKLKIEYYINDEETGGDKVDNNEFLIQLEYKF